MVSSFLLVCRYLGKFLNFCSQSSESCQLSEIVQTTVWLVFWYMLEHGAFTRVQLGLLAISNYEVYSSEPPSVWDNILLRFMFTGKYLKLIITYSYFLRF